MRVTVVPTIRDFPWGAPGQCMGELVRVLIDAGHEVLWFVAPIDAGHPIVASRAAAGAIVRLLPEPPPQFVRFPTIRQGLRQVLGGRKSLATMVDEFDPDHLFLNQGGTWTGMHGEFFDVLKSRQGCYSLICHLNYAQGVFSRKDLDRARGFIANARCVFFNSNWTHALAENQIARPISRAGRFQYPLRFDFAAPLPWPTNEVPVLAMVNRLDAFHKGIDLALQSVAELTRQGTMMRLRIYGRGSDEAYLRELASYLGVESMVDFLGYTEDLDRVWSEAEMLLLPSRYEGLAVSMLEAMGFGRVVLRTPYGGAAEWVEDGLTGFICPAAEPGALYQTLRRALAERNHWREMGLRAHEKLRRNREPNPAAVFLEALT